MTIRKMNAFYRTSVALLCLSGMLSSCYFNSTGRIYAAAQYEARANTADLNKAPNPVVYQNGENYYIELPRYRYGQPVKLQYSVFDQEEPAPAQMDFRGIGMFRISKEMALYLTGQTHKPARVTEVTEVPDAAEIKLLSRRIPVVKKADDHMVAYSYESPNSGWLHVAAPVNWLFVDLPVTVVENAAVVAAVAGVVWLVVEGLEDDCDDCCDDYHHHHHHHHRHHHH